jgi:hypothetical protein
VTLKYAVYGGYVVRFVYDFVEPTHKLLESHAEAPPAPKCVQSAVARDTKQPCLGIGKCREIQALLD